MRNPLAVYKEEIERIMNNTTTNNTLTANPSLTEEEVVARNNFILDFIVKQ